MTIQREPVPIGELLATESVQQVIANMEGYCACQKRVIELTNEPRIKALQYQGQILQEEAGQLVERLRHAPPTGSPRSRRVKAVLYCALAVLLIAAGCYFAYISLEPFRLGIKGLIYCAAAAILTPFLVHFVLSRFDTEQVIKWTAAIACLAAVVGMMLLAVIRGNIFMQEFEAINNASVVIDDAQPTTAQPETDFYRDTLWYLMVFMLLMALAMELGAGIALHETSRIFVPDSEDWTTMRKKLGLIRGNVALVIEELCSRQLEPDLFVSGFQRDFYRAMLTRTARSAIRKLIVLVVLIFICSIDHASAETQPLNLVIAVDLTKSVAVRGPDGQSEFQKNIDAVTKLLAEVPANTKLTVIGITDASFSQPYILLRVTVSADPGYFGERLTSAHNLAATNWRRRSSKLAPIFDQTDIIGALMLAGQVFDEGAGQKDLVILSDMRNTADLDLESQSLVPSYYGRLMGNRVVKNDLAGVKVFALGVTGAEKSPQYWQSLRRFWVQYFLSTGADLEIFSSLRELDHQLITIP